MSEDRSCNRPSPSATCDPCARECAAERWHNTRKDVPYGD